MEPYLVDGPGDDESDVVAGAAEDVGDLVAAHALQPVLVDLQDEVAGAEAAVRVRHAARQDRLDDDARLLPADDAEPQPAPRVHQLDHLHLAPVGGQPGGGAGSFGCGGGRRSGLCLRGDH